MEREPSGFPPSFGPSRYQQRTSGRGLITWTLIRNYTIDIIKPPKVHSLTTCDLASHSRHGGFPCVFPE